MQFAFAKMMWKVETFGEQLYGIVMAFVGYSLHCQFHACHLVLRGYLAFASLPGMERVIVYQFLSLAVFSCLVEQGGIFDEQVIALLHEIKMALKISQAFVVWLLHALVELVKLHENTGVVGVEAERQLHISQGIVVAVLFVEQEQGEVAPYSWEPGIELRRELPVVVCLIVLTLVVVEASKIVGREGTSGICLFCHI